MEIYIKDKDGKLQETTLFNLLNKAFKKAAVSRKAILNILNKKYYV